MTRPGINYMAVLAATIAAFVAGSIWYMGLGGMLAELSAAYAGAQSPSGWVLLGEFLRNLVVSYALARLIALARVDGWKGAVGLGAGLWVFPALILAGSVLHERYPPTLAAIHAGDWLIKLLVMAAIIGALRQKTSEK